jgi:hypothetical protein
MAISGSLVTTANSDGNDSNNPTTAKSNTVVSVPALEISQIASFGHVIPTSINGYDIGDESIYNNHIADGTINAVKLVTESIHKGLLTKQTGFKITSSEIEDDSVGRDSLKLTNFADAQAITGDRVLYDAGNSLTTKIDNLETSLDGRIDALELSAPNDDVYDASDWNSKQDGATRNAIRDKFVSVDSIASTNTAHSTGDGSDHADVADNTTNIGINTTAISNLLSDVAFDSSWNGVTSVGPSKNAVYDEVNKTAIIKKDSADAQIITKVFTHTTWNMHTTPSVTITFTGIAANKVVSVTGTIHNPTQGTTIPIPQFSGTSGGNDNNVADIKFGHVAGTSGDGVLTVYRRTGSGYASEFGYDSGNNLRVVVQYI